MDAVKEALIKALSQIPAILGFLVLVSMFQTDARHRDTRLEALIKSSVDSQKEIVRTLTQNNNEMKNLSRQLEMALGKN